MENNISQFISEILIPEKQLKEKLTDLAKEITLYYKDKLNQNDELVLIAILKGASFFLSDLMREIEIDHKIDFMAVSSYGASTTTSGIVKILKDIDENIKNKYVLIIEDIIDTGLTMKYLLKFLYQKEPKDIKICVLLNKPARRRVNIDVDFVGFTIEDKFVVGYGLDFNEEFRQLPYIGVLDYNKYKKYKTKKEE